MRVSIILAVLCIAGIVRADVIILDDGTRIEGKLQKTPQGYSITKADGTVVNVTQAHVASFEIGHGSTKPSDALSALTSLRDAVSHNSDLNQIISKYQDFIKRTTDPNVLSEANKDLKTWQDRQSQGLVKLGDNWIKPEERDAIEQKAQAEALPARGLILQAKYKDAMGVLQQALKDDPQSAAALYFEGLCQLAQGQGAQARKTFETLNAQLPSHGPTLNNLAVILWRTKSYGGALTTFQKAMTVSPMNKEILDNVAEALQGTPDSIKTGPLYQPVAAMFRKQDMELQRQAEQQGFYRWGSAWVTAKQLDELKVAQAKIDDEKKKLGDQYEADAKRLTQLDQQISDDTRQMNYVQSQAVGTSAQGQPVQTLLPPLYYQLNGDIQSMRTEEESLRKDQEKLKAQAIEAQQTLPAAQYSGTVQMMGPDYAPLSGPAGENSPTTRPVFQSTLKPPARREKPENTEKPANSSDLPSEFR